jgi:serine/threonine-protein kinase RsbW
LSDERFIFRTESPEGAVIAMSAQLTLHVRNRIGAISPANETAESWLAAQQVPPQGSFFVALAIEELVTNCIKYAYDDGGEHVIDILLSVAGQELTMTVVDDGRAFDPLQAPSPDLSLSIEDRPVGGLGLHLLRALADEIAYERRDGANRVTLIKRIV